MKVNTLQKNVNKKKEDQLGGKIPEKEIIIEQSKKEWPEDFQMQEYYINNQLDSLRQLKKLKDQYKNKKLVEIIMIKAKDEWPNNYEMQLYTARVQMESYKRINNKHR